MTPSWVSRGRIVLSAAALLLLTACVQGRAYQRPAVDMPTSWNQLAGTEAVSKSGASDGTPEAEWWKAFGDQDLTELIERAVEQNHDVRRAVSRLVEGRASVLSASSGLYPQVNVQSSYANILVSKNTLAGLGLAAGRQPGPQVFAAPGTSFDLWNGAADLRWEVDLWGKIRRSVEAASAEADALSHDARAVTLALIGDVGQAYFRIRELDEQLRIAERMLALRRDSLGLVEARASAGLASELDVARAQVLVADSAGQIPEWQRLRSIELHRLEVLTGAPPGTLSLASRGRALAIQPQVPLGLPSHLLERRPDILQAEATLMAANARIGQARAQFFPGFSITGQGGLQSVEFANWFSGNSWNHSIGPSITLPIFLGGTNVARLDAAESQYVQMLERYRQTILVAFREVADLLVSLHRRADQLARQREQVDAARTAVELAEVRYRQGLVNYLDVLDAQRTVLAAEIQLAQTERARLTDMVGLFKALGGGWSVAREDGDPAAATSR